MSHHLDSVNTTRSRLLCQVFGWLPKISMAAGYVMSATSLVFHFQPILAAEDQPLTAAVKMLPAETQAMAVLPNSDQFLNAWNRTELGKLASDSRMKPFWEGQNQEIEGRLKEAGLQLSLDFEDLSNIAGGQSAIAWISRPSVAAKPFSVALIMDVAGRIAPAENFLKKVDTQLKARGAVAKTIEVAGASVFQYSTAKIVGESRARGAYYVLSKDQMIATDDLDTIKELLEAQDGNKKDSLANTELFQTVQAKIKSDGEEPEVEYFVRPIGFAKLLRSISGKPSNNQADVLKILEGEGFSELKCVAGNIRISSESFDFFHNGFVVAVPPLSRSVQLLDFPNLENLTPPSWINKESASVLSFSWNFKDAFSKFDGFVDAYVGKDTFAAVMDGIKTDPNGPQIDIIKEILPFVSSEFHVVTEIVKPIGPLSKRSMVFLKLNDPDMKLPKILERYGKSEPHATPIDVEGFRVWRINNDTEEEVELDFDKDDSMKQEMEEGAEEPLLDQWAISIVNGYFIFASDAELITDTIRNAKSNEEAFMKEADVTRLTNILKDVAAHDSHSMIQMTRADRAFEMQYEMFREGTLPDSKSMLATILDKILKPTGRANQQKVNGAALPAFAVIKDFFTPSGGVVRTEKDGWSIQSFILSK